MSSIGFLIGSSFGLCQLFFVLFICFAGFASDVEWSAEEAGVELSEEQKNAITTDRWTSGFFFFISFITAFFGIVLFKFRDHILPKEERDTSFAPVSVSIGGGSAPVISGAKTNAPVAGLAAGGTA